MSELFRPISLYERVPDVAFDMTDGYVSAHAPPGAWPAEQGCPGATSRSGDALVSEHWQLAWKVPLKAAVAPDSILVGNGAVMVSGESAREVFTLDGKLAGSVQRAPGGCFFDLSGDRMLADDVEEGLFTYRLPELRRGGRIMLAYPSGYVTRTVLQGPGVLVILSVVDTPFGSSPNAVVEVVRARDWEDTGKRGVHYGLDPIAGIIREADGKARAAAAPNGPVLATPKGICWCDWRLQPLAETLFDMLPRALSVDEAGRAHLLCDVNGEAHFMTVAPGSNPELDLTLPWGVDASFVPPQLGLGGVVLLTPPEHAWVLEPDGRVRFRIARGPGTPAGSVAANGLFLLSDADLFLFTPEGERLPLWQPPAPLVTPPVLAGGRIYVASEKTLYALTMK